MTGPARHSIPSPTRGSEARCSRPMLGGRGWGRRGACPRAFASTAAIRSRCLRLGSSEHCGLEGCSAQRGGRGRGRCAAAPRIAVGLPSPPLKLRRVRARGREAEARYGLGVATGVGGDDPGAAQLRASVSSNPAGLRGGRETRRACEGGGGSSLFPSGLSLLRLKRVFPVGLPSLPEPAQRRAGPARAEGESRLEGGTAEEAESRVLSSSPACELPGPLFPIQWVFRGTLTEGFGKASRVILRIKAPI